MKARLADSDHRRKRQRARGIEAGIVEAGDDMCINALRLGRGDALQHARNRKRSVIIAFD